MKALFFLLVGLISFGSQASHFYHCQSLERDHWLQKFTVEVKREIAIFNGQDIGVVDHSYSPRNSRNFDSKLFIGDFFTMGDGSEGYNVSILLNKYLLNGADWGYATQRNDGYEYYQVTYKCEKSSLVEQALKYKKLINDAHYMSEGDFEWTPFYSKYKVSKTPTVIELQKVLESDLNRPVYKRFVNIMSPESIDRLFETYIHDNPYYDDEDGEGSEHFSESRKYYRWLRAMELDFGVTGILGVREGEADAGRVNVYIFGRKADGTVVGLKTISIET